MRACSETKTASFLGELQDREQRDYVHEISQVINLMRLRTVTATESYFNRGGLQSRWLLGNMWGWQVHTYNQVESTGNGIHTTLQ